MPLLLVITLPRLGVLLCALSYATAAVTGGPVAFPTVSEPILVVDNGKEHFYASYTGINSFSADSRYATVLETTLTQSLPTENDPADLLCVDLQNHTAVSLGKTRAWNFQQGCMAHWLGSAPNSQVIYNDLRDGRFVAIIVDVHTQQELAVIPYPVAAVSPDGSEAISINFSRLRATRTDYGYGGNGQDAQTENGAPDNDGLWRINLASGEATLLVSLADLARLRPKTDKKSLQYINHVLYSRTGKKIFFFSRARNPKGDTVVFVIDPDGSNLSHVFPDGWGGSHYNWLDDRYVLVTTEWKNLQFSHILVDLTDRKNRRRLGGGLLDYNGHPDFSSDGKWMVTDTYPYDSKLREQKLYLMDMRSEAVLPLGRFPVDEAWTRYWRCDLHPRWSPRNDLIGINSAHTGSRQAYLLRVDFTN